MRAIVADPGLQPFRNLFVGGNLSAVSVNSGTGATFTASVIAGASPAGRNIHRATYTVAPTAGEPAQYTAATTTAAVTPGQAYAFQAKVRTTQPWSVNLRVRWVDGSGTAVTSDGLGVVSTTAPGVWELRTVTGVAPVGAVGAFVLMRGPMTGWTNGIVTELAEVQVNTGSTVLPYGDGSFPGWRWTGVADASESVGYPYTLESIAGTPLATLATGQRVTGLALTATQGRTAYVVHDTIANVSTVAIANLGGTLADTTGGVGAMAYRHGGSTNTENRSQSVGSVAATFAAPTGVGFNTIGRHVGCFWMADGDQGYGAGFDGGRDAFVAQAPQSGLALASFGVGSANAGGTPLFGAVYAGTHDAETRHRVQAWLARRYGSPIPVGY